MFEDISFLRATAAGFFFVRESHSTQRKESVLIDMHCSQMVLLQSKQ